MVFGVQALKRRARHLAKATRLGWRCDFSRAAKMSSAVKEVDPTAIVVKNVLVLDSDGKRIVVKYYASDWQENPLYC